MKKNDDKKRRETLKEAETTTQKIQEEKNKSGIYNVKTPRTLVAKTAVDIYAQKNKNSPQIPKAPKKLPSASTKNTNMTQMKDSFKSSASAVKQDTRKDTRMRREDSKITLHSVKQTPRSTRNLPSSNVTVNSPVIQRKINLTEFSSKKDVEKAKMRMTKDIKKVENSTKVDKSNKDIFKLKEVNKTNAIQGEFSKEVFERQRTKTRTLDENEVKVLTPEIIDNNAEMLNLSRKLTAKPKAFYIDLEAEKPKVDSKSKIDKTSDEEVSYEDDFESYESDFESYRSESAGDGSVDSKEDIGNENADDSKNVVQNDEAGLDNEHDYGLKETRDEERMLDSGSYDLRDRSAKAKPTTMENILEDAEDSIDKKVSLTDEGFQEMSSSSAVSSMRTVNVDLLNRPLFIDFTKSKQNKRRRLIFERLKQRAEDLLSMISLHEMSYSLFEMKPISYDVYMATFGRNNYTQTSVQTNEDSVTEETQTEEILRTHKWTQNPVEFSKYCTYLYTDVHSRKYSKTTVDYISKFNYLLLKTDDVTNHDQINSDEEYKRNPLRIYLEQKDGVGASEMLPYDKYETKLKIKDYNSDRLRRVLKKFESRISNILNFNNGSNVFSDSIKSTKVPFSKGYTTIAFNRFTDNYKFLNNSRITQMFFSESLSNLVMTVHRLNFMENKCLVCLWDISVANQEPLKILIAIDCIIFGRFSGKSDGILVAALEDGTIHLWDLSEEPTWRNSVAKETDSTNLEGMNTDNFTEFEKDREWNLKHSQVQNDTFNIACALHACSYTSSATVMVNGDDVDRIVGFEFSSRDTITQDGGRKIIGQVISLQRAGILTTWSIVQERSINPSKDLGKAYWSKMLLEKLQCIELSHYIHLPSKHTEEALDCFNLPTAKSRIFNRKKEQRELKRMLSRQKSAKSSEIDRLSSANNAKVTEVLPVMKSIKIWEEFICNSLKIMQVNDTENILVAKDRGEVLCCVRVLGITKVKKFCVASDASSITSLEVSPQGLPYFLAATDSGTVNLCSILENRVLLTLDCRNIPTTLEMTDKCVSDHKGRFIGSISKRNSNISEIELYMFKISVRTVLWSPVNPCCIYALLGDGTLLAWDLTSSDIYGKCSGQNATALVAGNSALALLTPEGEVQIHRFNDEQRTKENLVLFKKYVALL